MSDLHHPSCIGDCDLRGCDLLQRSAERMLLVDDGREAYERSRREVAQRAAVDFWARSRTEHPSSLARVLGEGPV